VLDGSSLHSRDVFSAIASNIHRDSYATAFALLDHFVQIMNFLASTPLLLAVSSSFCIVLYYMSSAGCMSADLAYRAHDSTGMFFASLEFTSNLSLPSISHLCYLLNTTGLLTQQKRWYDEN
jgi:hypothetical protein